jgi:hypothetical protein
MLGVPEHSPVEGRLLPYSASFENYAGLFVEAQAGTMVLSGPEGLASIGSEQLSRLFIRCNEPGNPIKEHVVAIRTAARAEMMSDLQLITTLVQGMVGQQAKPTTLPPSQFWAEEAPSNVIQFPVRNPSLQSRPA